jgi:hypothetical protein
MHLDDSTAGSGGFRLLLNSDWVQTARPDYVTISPVCSWKNLAQHYMRMQALALAGRDHLPSFEGTAQQKIDQVVEYIEDHGIRYDEKLDAGGYPRQDVADIVKLRRTDCKGLTTLLYALLQNSGVKSDPVAMNAAGMTPMSFSVPDNWPNHAMLFIPSIDRYVDLTVVLKSHGKYTWQSSADSYAGEVVLDLVTGRFEVVPPRLVSSED